MNEVQRSDRTLIETVAFLAGLVSETRVMDGAEHKLQEIVRSGNTKEALTEKERTELMDLREQLEEHLIQKDTLRSFTPEALEESVEAHMDGGTSRRGLFEALWFVLALTTSYVFGMFLFPSSPLEARFLLAAPFPLLTLYVVIVWMFWEGVKNFKQELRKAYVWISVGIFLTGIGAAQGPILLAVPELTRHPLFAYDGLLALFSLSCLAILIGLRSFMRFVGGDGFISSKIFIVIATAVTVGLVPFIPHGAVPDEWAFDLASVSLVLCSVYSVPAAWFAYKIAAQITTGYARAMRWLCATMALVAVNTVYVLIMILLTGPVSGIRIAFIAAPFVISGILMFIAGYEFRKSSGNA